MVVYPVDAGIIRCICGFDHDDKFTIQCDKCNVWQHAICVSIKDEKAVPDVYLCDRCGRSDYDVESAIEAQTRYLRKKKRGKRLPDNSAEPASSLPANIATEPRRRSKKKRNDDELEDQALSCFVPCHSSSISLHAQQILQDYRSEGKGLRTYTKSEFRTSKASALSVQRCSDAYGPCGFTVICQSNISRGRFVTELKGEVISLEEYIQAPWNQYWIWRCPKPGVIRIPGLPIMVDGRCTGTVASLVRRSSTPNLRVEQVLVDGDQRFALYASQSIRAGAELSIGWMWDESFPLSRPSEHTQFSSLLESLDADENIMVYKALSELKSSGVIDAYTDCIPQPAPKPAPASNSSLHVNSSENTAPKAIEQDLDQDMDPEDAEDYSAALVNHKSFGRSSTKNRLLEAARGSQKTEAIKSEPVAVFERSIWVPANLKPDAKVPMPVTASTISAAAAPAAGPEPKKKKLSLAEYKKKRPSAMPMHAAT